MHQEVTLRASDAQTVVEWYQKTRLSNVSPSVTWSKQLPFVILVTLVFTLNTHFQNFTWRSHTVFHALFTHVSSVYVLVKTVEREHHQQDHVSVMVSVLTQPLLLLKTQEPVVTLLLLQLQLQLTVSKLKRLIKIGFFLSNYVLWIYMKNI